MTKNWKQFWVVVALAGMAERLGAQTVTIDTSKVGQVIDGFGTCLSGTEATQTSWWTNLYYGDLEASMLRMDLSPAFRAQYSANAYNSPSYGNAGPQGNYARAYTNAVSYTNVFNGQQAQIAVMGPNIDSNILYFDYTTSGSGPQVAGTTARTGAGLKTRLGDFKLFGSMWSPEPWVKVTDGNTYQGGGANLPTNGTAFPFIWLGNYAGGKLDVSGTPLAVFDDTALGGTGPTSALTQFARATAAYVRGFQNAYGVSFYSICIQNELDFDEFYNSCNYAQASAYTAALKAVRAEFDKYTDLTPIKLMGPEDVLGGDPYGMWQYGSGATASAKNLQFLQAIGADPVASNAEGFFCVHGYASDGIAAGAATPTQWLWWANGWTTSPAAGIPANVGGFTSYGKKSWMTETSGENPAWLYPTTGFPNGGAWSIALRMQQALAAGQESGWAYWQMTDGNAVGTETLTDATQLQNSPKYVAVKHFLRYVRPNAVSVAATVTGAAALSASAFWHATNGTMTVVLINETNTPITAVVQSPAAPTGINYWQTFTSSNGSYWQATTNAILKGQAQVTVPGYGVVTLYGAAPPHLGAVPALNGGINLFWPPSANGLFLQATTNLGLASSWADVAGSDMVTNGLSNGLVSVSVASGGAAVFYRLAGN